MLHTMEGMRRWYWGTLVERTGGGREVGLRNVWILCVKASQHVNFFPQRAKIKGSEQVVGVDNQMEWEERNRISEKTTHMSRHDHFSH